MTNTRTCTEKVVKVTRLPLAARETEKSNLQLDIVSQIKSVFYKDKKINKRRDWILSGSLAGSATDPRRESECMGWRCL